MNSDVSVLSFAVRFITGRLDWRDVPRLGLINFGNIISLVIYRSVPFQVELFIVPHAPSFFTEHRHPNVDVVEFPLAGVNRLYINGVQVHSDLDTAEWVQGLQKSPLIQIKPTDLHSGDSHSPYAFLSIQKWLNGVTPTSVGLDWDGEPASPEQRVMLQRD